MPGNITAGFSKAAKSTTCRFCTLSLSDQGRFSSGEDVYPVYPPNHSDFDLNKTNDLILNLTPENMTQHSRIE